MYLTGKYNMCLNDFPVDLSLYTDESQLEKKSRKRNSSKSSPSDATETAVSNPRDNIKT